MPNLPLQVNIGRGVQLRVAQSFVKAASLLQTAELSCVPDGDQHKPGGMGTRSIPSMFTR